MISETLRMFQVQTRQVNGLANATEFRHSDGRLTYTVTVINEDGYATIPLNSREEAIECADNYIAQFALKLCYEYNVTPQPE